MRTLFILFLFSGFASCAQTPKQNTPPVPKDWKKLENSQYSIQYPPNWEADDSGKMGATFFLFSPAESEQDDFRENINLLIQDLTGKDIDLDKFTEISEGQVKTMVTNSNILESKRVKNGSDVYHKIIYSGDQEGFQLTFEQYYWVIKNKAYILTFTSVKDKFAGLKETGEAVLNSFKLKK